MVAVRMRELARALGRMEEENRALLDLSMRRGMPDEEIADILRVDPGEIEQRRAALLDRLASELGLDGREQQDELFATLQDLPAGLWRGWS